MQFWSIVQRTASYSDTEKLLPVSFGLVTFKNSNVYVWPLYRDLMHHKQLNQSHFALKFVVFITFWGPEWRQIVQQSNNNRAKLISTFALQWIISLLFIISGNLYWLSSPIYDITTLFM